MPSMPVMIRVRILRGERGIQVASRMQLIISHVPFKAVVKTLVAPVRNSGGLPKATFTWSYVKALLCVYASLAYALADVRNAF